MNAVVKQVNTPKTPQAAVQVQLSEMKDKFEAALPDHIPADRFVRVAMSAILNPMVAKVAGTPSGRKSIYDACLKAATDGLLLDNREAALVPMGVKQPDGSWVDHAQYMPMVAGIMKKARNSGDIASIFCQVVYENDDFTVDLVTDGVPISHRPKWGDRGPVVGVYAIARLKDGSWTQPEVMDVEQINKIKSLSKTGAKGNGPWAAHWEEMARKTVIRRASKYWPSSTDRDQALIDVTRRDDSDYVEHVQSVEPERKQPIAASLLSESFDPDDQPDDAQFEEQRDAIELAQDDVDRAYEAADV